MASPKQNNRRSSNPKYDDENDDAQNTQSVGSPDDSSLVPCAPSTSPTTNVVTRTVAPLPADGDVAVTPVKEQAGIGRPWTTGLFDCGENGTNATLTAFLPCVTFGQIAEILDEGHLSCTLGSFLYILMAPALCSCSILGSGYRQKLRKKYNLVQAPAEDWIIHLFCPCCALCQEFRELQNRGIDPSRGWMGYLAQEGEAITSPPKNQHMTQ